MSEHIKDGGEAMDCSPVEPATVPLSVDLIGQLEGLRDEVTYRFVLREEEKDGWDASGPFADCEDIALFYQQKLLAQGYERGASLSQPIQQQRSNTL